MNEEQELIGIPGRLHRPSEKSFVPDGQPRLKLQEVILVGNYSNQIKFSELTLDMYRMLQALEREPSVPGSSQAETEEGANPVSQSPVKRSNPHKYLLYRPSLGVLMNYLSIGFKDLGENNSLLVYLSADGLKLAHKNDFGMPFLQLSVAQHDQ